MRRFFESMARSFRRLLFPDGHVAYAGPHPERARMPDVDEDGMVRDALWGVEARHCPYVAIGYGPRYLRVVGDHGMFNVEIRIPFSELAAFGFKYAEPEHLIESGGKP